MNISLKYWLSAFYLPKTGARKFLQWVSLFGSIEELMMASVEKLKAVGMNEMQIHALKNPDHAKIENDLTWAVMPNHHLIHFDDERYPPLLKEIADPPLIIFIKGNPAVLSQPQIAMVGSRHASAGGMINAERFAKYLSGAGLTVTSGLAQGIDAASHRGVLQVQGLTIAVAGTGLSHTYPASHRDLALAIVQQGGAVISDYPLDMPAMAHHFPRRNRIISGLSLGVLVVEAALKSGSLITARLALSEGREVFAIPGSIHHPLSRGCHHLIRQGAKLVETVEDILEELGALQAWMNQKREPKTAEKCSNLSLQHQQILSQIDYVVTPIDVIILRSQLTTGEVSSILLSLELHGYIQSIAGGYMRTVLN